LPVALLIQDQFRSDQRIARGDHRQSPDVGDVAAAAPALNLARDLVLLFQNNGTGG
jgi:hypothetical protein